MSQKRKSRWWMLGLAVALVAGGVVLFTALSKPNTRIDPTKLARVERGDLARSVVATGKIEPIARVEIKSKASGIIQKLLVDVGDRVKEGDVLAELDRDQLSARVRQLEATLAASEANVTASRASYEKMLADAKGVDVPFLKRQMERSRGLLREGLIPPQALDDAEKAYEMAVNKQQQAQASADTAKADIGQAEAHVKEARASLEQAREDLLYATIRSPINGVALSRNVELGDAVSSILVMGSAATLIMTLGDMRELYVKGKVDESDVGKIYVGQPARITVETFKERKYLGKVTRISPMGEEKDNVTTFEVRVSILQPRDLKALMTANAEIILEEHKNVLTIPEAAVVYNRDKTTWVETPDPAQKNGKRKTAVKTGISNGARTEVLAGLQEGQEVVLQ
ncbi:MAG TPA: efflux RND transporter periplasmic adaptor subunit [Bryobacterales bacterium]|nr:efflux RND transporter periplasmic adaptor subunit [Bryobacterales bacterium]